VSSQIPHIKLLEAANARLKSGKLGFKIEITESNFLCLRGTLPCKPGVDKPASTQRIFLSYPITPEAIKQAEKDAIAVRGSLIEEKFNWYDWNRSLQRQIEIPQQVESIPQLSVKTIVERFEQDFFTRRLRDSKSETTWKGDYKAVFRHLPQDRCLTPDMIMSAISTTVPESRQRKRFCLALRKLAEFAEININLSGYGGGYTPAKLEPRNLPSDEEIVTIWRTIPNLSWRNFFGLCAVFGLRPHETMHLDFSTFPELIVLDETKTGRRLTRAIHPDWLSEFNLVLPIELPILKVHANREIGDRAVTQFKRYNIPFPPYNLRHAWAIRGSITYAIPTAVIAKMMGHSVSVHENTYLRHLRDDHAKSIYDQAVKNMNLKIII
jgi:integrase